MPRLCLDASFVVAWLLPEDLSDRAYELKKRWDAEGFEIAGPPLLPIETTSVIRQAIHRGRVTREEGEEAFLRFLDLPIRLGQPTQLLQKAWDWGRRLNAPRLYDMFYLALADIEKHEFWTGDRRLFNLCRSHFSGVNYLGGDADAS